MRDNMKWYDWVPLYGIWSVSRVKETVNNHEVHGFCNLYHFIYMIYGVSYLLHLIG